MSKKQRLVNSLYDRIQENNKESFYCVDDPMIILDKKAFSIMNSPNDNIEELMIRIQRVKDILDDHYLVVSKASIGKTVNMRKIFACKNKMDEENPDKVMIMVTLKTFTIKDIPKDFKEDWKMDVFTFSSLYENLLIQELKHRNEYQEDENDSHKKVMIKSNENELILYVTFYCQRPIYNNDENDSQEEVNNSQKEEKNNSQNDEIISIQ